MSAFEKRGALLENYLQLLTYLSTQESLSVASQLPSYEMDSLILYNEV